MHGYYSVLESFADDLAAVGDDHEGGGLYFVDIFPQLSSLRTAHNGDDDLLGLVAESTLCFVDGGAVTELLHDIIADRFGILADDIEGFAQVDALDDIIHYEGFCQQTENGIKTCLNAEGEECRADDQKVGDQQGVADVEAGIFF